MKNFMSYSNVSPETVDNETKMVTDTENKVIYSFTIEVDEFKPENERPKSKNNYIFLRKFGLQPSRIDQEIILL